MANSDAQQIEAKLSQLEQRANASIGDLEARTNASITESERRTAVAARHVLNASPLRPRSVLRDVRWRWTLKMLWTAA
jgi:hypothetical protein